MELPNDPAIPLLGIFLKKPKCMHQNQKPDVCTPVFIAALFTVAKMWKQPKCPLVGNWIEKM